MPKDYAPVAGEASTSLAGADFTGVTTAVNLPANEGQWVMVLADPANTVDILVGISASVFPIKLVAGGNIVLPVANSNLIWVKSQDGTTSANYSFIAGS